MKIELVLYISICVILSLMIFRGLFKTQCKLPFVRTGWIIVIAVILYGLITPLVYIVDEDFFVEVFDRVFFVDTICNGLKIVTISMLGFCCGEVILDMLLSRKAINKEFAADVSFFIRYDKQMLYIAGFLLVSAIYLYFKRWASVGGFWAMLDIGRAEALYDIQENSTFIRYDIMLFLSWSFYIFPFLYSHRYVLKRIIGGLYLVLFAFIFLSGARLPILILLMTLLLLLFYLKKDWLKRNIKKFCCLGVVVYLLFNSYSYFRENIRYQLLGSNSNVENVGVKAILFPAEVMTFHVAAQEMLSNPNVYNDNQLLKFVPNTLRNIFGMESYIPYSARLQYQRGNNSTLTVPLPLDVYFGVGGNLLLLFLYFLFFYLFFEWGVICLMQKKYALFYISWIYSFLYYMIRTESISWFSRAYLLFIIGVVVLFGFNVIRRLKWN